MNARVAFASLLVVAGCASGASPSSSTEETASVALTTLATPVTYETIVDLVRSRNIRSIDSLLGQPEFPKTFRRGFTTVFRSRSIQYADPLNPRVIVYGEDAKLVLAFTCAEGDCVGNPNAVTGGEHLEMVQWRDATRSFEYRDITFPESGAGEPTFSDANPSQCLGCHTSSDPRPNFEPYNQWPGLYGGNDDGAQPKRLVEGESRDKLEQFLAGGAQRPRYRHLDELAEGYQYLYTFGGVTYADPRTKKNHNIDLNEALYLLNDERIADRIAKLAFYDDIKHTLVFGLDGGDISGPLKDLGQTEIAALVDRCTSSAHPASRVIKLLYGLGVDSLPWFLSFGAGLESELLAPALSVESKVEHELFARDGELMIDRDERLQKARDGWTRLLATRPVRDSLTKCVAERAR